MTFQELFIYLSGILRKIRDILMLWEHIF